MSDGENSHGPRVVVKIVGGLGNQLFCYATARALALRGGAELELDVDFFRSDVRYEREYRLDRFALAPHRLRSTRRWLPRALDLRWWRVKRSLARHGLVPGLRAVVEAGAKHFHDELPGMRWTGTLLLDGYWQDERYFKDARAPLLSELRVAREPDERHRSLGQAMRASHSVAVHCRRHHHRLADGSVHAAKGRTGLDVQYYRRALAQLSARVRPDHLYLFGDEPEWLTATVPEGVPTTVVDWNGGPGGEVWDLWLMTQCRHCIVSNSTLSWWGAWLGSDADRIVIAPKPQDLEYWVPNARGWQEIAW